MDRSDWAKPDEVSEEERERAAVHRSHGPARPRQALLWGLRRTADEAQMTQVIAEVARADGRFASAFVRLLLDSAAEEDVNSNASAFLHSGLPDVLGCRAEEHLRDTDDAALGRVDLRFDGPDNFTLFVENKLYSGYGSDQIGRYLRALRRLPPEGRSALIAVTRTVPTYGEPALDSDQRWLGSVRWAKMATRLRELPIGDSGLAAQWRSFVEILELQGDLGMTRVDADLIRAWARYREGRTHLGDLLDQVWPRTQDHLQRQLKATYRTPEPAEALATIYRRGKQRQIVVQRDQTRVYVGYAVPAVVKDPAVLVQFSGHYGIPHFTIQVEPWESQRRLEEGDPQLAKASEELKQRGFQTNGDYWARVHEPSEYIESEDVPKRLLALIEDDVASIAASRILKLDLDLGLSRARSGPARHRRLPAEN